jgi:hypothetical protein
MPRVKAVDIFDFRIVCSSFYKRDLDHAPVEPLPASISLPRPAYYSRPLLEMELEQRQVDVSLITISYVVDDKDCWHFTRHFDVLGPPDGYLILAGPAWTELGI